MARKLFLKALKQLLVTSMVLTLCISVTLARHRTQLLSGSMQTDCSNVPHKIRMPVPGPRDGCEATSTIVKVCSGLCPSQTVMQVEPPFTNVSCSCCGASHWRVKPRRLNFTCNGVIETHRIYLPIAEQCGCINCYDTL